MRRRTKVFGLLAIAALLLLAGCTNNIFASFDEPDPGPSADELRSQYQSATGARRVELAADAGTARIVDNDAALETVNNFSKVITTLSNSDTSTPSPEQVMADLFPTNLSPEEAQALVDTFKEAATDFMDFANNAVALGEGEDPLSSGEKGDAVQMAVISIAIKEIADSGNEDQLVDLLSGQKTEDELSFTGNNPFENLGESGASSDPEVKALDNLMTYAGLGDVF